MQIENPYVKSVVDGNTSFAIDLYKNLKVFEGNFATSPYSISVALAMTYAGARGNTERQIAQTLHFGVGQEQLHKAFAVLETRLIQIQKESYNRLGAANSLWPQKGYPFLQAYLALMQECYGVTITPVDYTIETETARMMINESVETKTENRITELIKSDNLDSLTRLLLVNAIYFKGIWASKFDPETTREAAFWTTDTDSISVPLMSQTQTLPYRKAGDLRILELPYVGHDLSMIVLLPRKADMFSELEEALTPERLEKWTSNLVKTEVTVFLPKFKMTAEFQLNSTLAPMGMPDAFDDGKADFAGMDGRSNWLFINAVLHKTFVEVNEEGTEATTATTAVMAVRGMPDPPVVFRADHPFIFLIRDNVTQNILFFGRVVRPVVN